MELLFLLGAVDVRYGGEHMLVLHIQCELALSFAEYAGSSAQADATIICGDIGVFLGRRGHEGRLMARGKRKAATKVGDLEERCVELGNVCRSMGGTLVVFEAGNAQSRGYECRYGRNQEGLAVLEMWRNVLEFCLGDGFYDQDSAYQIAASQSPAPPTLLRPFDRGVVTSCYASAEEKWAFAG
ncbi:hypothetical protein HK097_009534 [Rhizophlyctis rosea]|uniref:Uncharacterized protein n=1 Tax=Rhizophlyctis rosea TaxID=64517 RepID=A0AAD5X0D1_9FUNG|nr:hypothetical protein HK097_009534 [Rhizophlyctis rosea]